MLPELVKVGAVCTVLLGGTTIAYSLMRDVVSVSMEYDQGQYSHESIAKQHGNYLLSSKSNARKWKKRFANRGLFNDANKPTDKFGTVTEAYSEKSNTSLNNLCNEAYKETRDSNLQETSTDSSKFSKFNIWKFCASGDIGLVGTNDYPLMTGIEASNMLVSTRDDSYNWFWKERTNEFWSEQGERSGSRANKKGSIFNSLYQDPERKWTNVKEACESAYKHMGNPSDSGRNKEDADRFCSLQINLPH